jgi:hypothetical protein
VQQHTEILREAKKWESNQRNDSFLLQGEELAGAEKWLEEAEQRLKVSESVPDTERKKDPNPLLTEQQRNFIHKNRENEDAKARAERILREAKEKADRRTKISGGLLVVSLIGALIAGTVAGNQIKIADGKTIEAGLGKLEVSLAKLTTLVQKLLGDLIEEKIKTAEAEAKEIAVKVKEAEAKLKEANQKLKSAQDKLTLAQKQQQKAEIARQKADIEKQKAEIAKKNALDKQQEALEGSRIEQNGPHFATLLGKAELDGLLEEMKLGQRLHDFVKDTRPLKDYPALSPLFALRTILDNIHQRNQLEPLNLKEEFRSVNYSPDGQHLAIGSNDGTIRIWNLSSRQPPISWQSGHGQVLGVSFHPKQELLASASIDGTIQLWNLSGKRLHCWKGYQSAATGVSFSPDGEVLATSGDDYIAQVKLWYLSGKEKARIILSGHNRIEQVTFSPDGQILATAGTDGTARLWSLSGQQVGEFAPYGVFPDEKGPWIRSVSFSRDGKFLAVGDEGYEKVQLWHVERLEDLLKRGCHWLQDYFMNHPQELEVCRRYGKQ